MKPDNIPCGCLFWHKNQFPDSLIFRLLQHSRGAEVQCTQCFQELGLYLFDCSKTVPAEFHDLQYRFFPTFEAMLFRQYFHAEQDVKDRLHGNIQDNCKPFP